MAMAALPVCGLTNVGRSLAATVTQVGACGGVGGGDGTQPTWNEVGGGLGDGVRTGGGFCRRPRRDPTPIWRRAW